MAISLNISVQADLLEKRVKRKKINPQYYPGRWLSLDPPLKTSLGAESGVMVKGVDKNRPRQLLISANVVRNPELWKQI
jgi:hypothetical protein